MNRDREEEPTDVHDRPSAVSACDGVVFVDGPASTAIAFTPTAARKTSERLSISADEADRQRPGASPEAPYALVVDDDAFVLMAACDIIEAAGFRFFEAGSGDEAKAVLAANGASIALLFTDVEMPGETNGFALAHHVARHWPDIEIVVASGRVKPGPGEMPDKASFIGKPFSADVVHKHLRKTLPSAKMTPALRAGV